MRRWLIGVLALGAAGGAAWMFKGYLAGGVRSDAYHAAPACPEGRPTDACRAKVATVITSKQSTQSGRVWIHSLNLRLPDRSSATAIVSKAQADALAEGQALEVERWDGNVTRIYRGGEPEDLPQTPRAPTMLRTMGIALSLVAVGLLWVLAALLRKRR